jgi:Tfp pilus assembly protein PilV
MTRLTHRGARGVSLIEALVALAVMAFGMLGVVGMQTTLRSNADLSRQRAEAVRLAQEEIERLRNFSVLMAADAASGQLAYESIASAPAAVVPASAANTTFTRETVVATPAADDPLVRHVRVRVSWTDRRAEDQAVELSTVIAGVPPEVSALHAMRTDRGGLQQPQGRSPNIPRGAVDEGDGTSRFVPPGGPSTRSWVFSNATGAITRICDPAGTCTATNRWLLSGIVAFATVDPPTSGEAANPGDASLDMTISVDLSVPAVPDEPCAVERTPTRVNYYCAVPLNTLSRWSGRVVLSGFPKSTALADSSSSNYKVCRYTPDDRNLTARPTSETADYYNGRHPFTYLLVTSPQINKNFLVISAGDGGGTAFSCPDEDTSTLIESNTWPHDPAT